MAVSRFITNAVFNSSTYQQNELVKWKFLEEIEPSQDEDEDVGFLLRSPLPVTLLTVAYILFVHIIGPILMQNREPFQLKSLIRFYNLLMVFTAGLLLVNIYDAVGSLSAMVDCDKIFTFSDDSGTKVYRLANLILAVRLSEYLDTIFFTLRKKQNQVTFLHVFHHAFVPMYAFWVLRTAPLRYNVFIILINSFIHVLMYFYYFLATFQQPQDSSGTRKESDPGIIMAIITQLLKFKKYMTQLQILQFVALAVYSFIPILQENRCGVPGRYVIANLSLAGGFLGLFLHFYITIYRGTRSTKSKRN